MRQYLDNTRVRRAKARSRDAPQKASALLSPPPRVALGSRLAEMPTPMVPSVSGLAQSVRSARGLEPESPSLPPLDEPEFGGLEPRPASFSADVLERRLTPAAFLLFRLTRSLSTLLEVSLIIADCVTEGWKDFWEVVLRLAISDCLSPNLFTAAGGRALSDVPQWCCGERRLPSVADVLSSLPAARGVWMSSSFPFRERGATQGEAGRLGVRYVSSLATLTEKFAIGQTNDVEEPVESLPLILLGSRFLIQDESGPSSRQAPASAVRREQQGGSLWSSLSALFVEGAVSENAAEASERLTTSVLTAVAAAASLPSPTPSLACTPPLSALLALTPALSESALVAMAQALATITISDQRLLVETAAATQPVGAAASAGVVVSEGGHADTIATATVCELLTSLLLRNVHRAHLLMPSIAHHSAQQLGAAAAVAADLALEEAPNNGSSPSDNDGERGVLPPFFSRARATAWLCERVVSNAVRVALGALSDDDRSADERVSAARCYFAEAFDGGGSFAAEAVDAMRSLTPTPQQTASSSPPASSSKSTPVASPLAVANQSIAFLLMLPSAAFVTVAPRVSAGVAALWRVGPSLSRHALASHSTALSAASLAALRVFFESTARLLKMSREQPCVPPLTF